ncbi:RING zinc finger-containing protein [Reticulomyxa filosa]|uniref:RING-type E3 ubiquitin transferase (cysteine targeting) n=1 Tax=Reticulomyxa filosa TaxID=46433 RepID=X6NRV2_RETFI|nr:RING zinc finger-containing protein [Reticulomyxa filosa]|eukprot:ETO28429.1 RING zinc finger-containing protein [Reticulomyxa filosa]
MESKPSDHLLASEAARVNQLDALALDNELRSSLKTLLGRIFKHFPMSSFPLRYEIEIEAAVELMLYFVSMPNSMSVVSTPGAIMQNIEYQIPISGRTRAYFLILSVAVPYVWRRLARHTSESGSNTTNQWIHRISVIVRILALANWLWFIREGKYRSLTERILGVEMKYTNPNIGRAIVFDFMNQQLVWTALSDFLLCVVPLINFRQAARTMQHMYLGITQLTWTMSHFQQEYHKLQNETEKPVEKVVATKQEQENQFKEDMWSTPCVICRVCPITIPCKSVECEHWFCYYCLEGHLRSEGGKLRCPGCYQLITKTSLVQLPTTEHYTKY